MCADEVADLLEVLFGNLLFLVEKVIAFQAEGGKGVLLQGLEPGKRWLDVVGSEGVQRQLVLVGGVPVGCLPVARIVQLVDPAADHLADEEDEISKGRVLLPALGNAEGRRVDLRVEDRGEWRGDRGGMGVAERQVEAHLVGGANADLAGFLPDIPAHLVGEYVVIRRIPLHLDHGDAGLEFKECLELCVISSELL